MPRLLQHPGLASTNNSEGYGRYRRPLDWAEHLPPITLQDDRNQGRSLRTEAAMVLVSTSNKNFQLKLELALSAPVLALAPCFFILRVFSRCGRLLAKSATRHPRELLHGSRSRIQLHHWTHR